MLLRGDLNVALFLGDQACLRTAQEVREVPQSSEEGHEHPGEARR